MLPTDELTATAGSVASDVAAGHLRALGCDVVVHAGPAAGGVTAGAEVGHGHRLSVECAIDWAGPVDAPLHDEALVQAACGIMHVHGRRSGAPCALHVDYVTTAAGVLAATGVLAGLVGRLRGIDIQSVRTSVAEAGLLGVSQYLAAATAADDEWREPLRPGGPPFVSADGVRFEIETLRAEGWVRFWTLLDADAAALRRGWRSFEQRFATGTCPLADDLHVATARRRFEELSGLAAAAGISIMALRDQAAGRAERLEAGTAGRPPWEITRLGQPAPHPAAAYGEPTMPLAGLVVVEATRRLQGPLAGHLLSLLGAHVIHVEPPGGDPLRGAPPMAGDTSARFVALNRLKHRVEADLATPSGRRTVCELVADADVFVHNWSPGKAAQLGLDGPDLAAIAPGLVYAYASAWGPRLGARPGLGTDFMVQAFSGLAAVLRPGAPAAASLMTLTDLLGGMVCAEGVVAGLLARLRTGTGQRVDSSLLSAATTLLEPARSRPPWTVLHEPLATADGYLALSAPARQRPREVGAALGADHDRDIAAALVGEVTSVAIERLRDAGLGAVAVCTDLSTLTGDPRFARALEPGPCTLPRAPWSFAS